MSVITEDELLIGYQSSKQVKERSETIGEPIPIVYIPRKPHPIGVLNYLLISFVDDPIKSGKKRPEILDLQPHIKSGDTSLIEITSNLLNRWTLPDRPHFIGESAFGSLDAIQAIADWGDDQHLRGKRLFNQRFGRSFPLTAYQKHSDWLIIEI